MVEPVSVPHDGPLKHEDAMKEEERVGGRGSGITEALSLLQNQDESILEVKTVKGLQKAASIRDQLACLRAYRSTLLNLQSREKNVNEKVQETPNVFFVGMYRVLLELGLSNETPHALKRASQSCLTALATFELDETIYDKINEDVVSSLLDSSAVAQGTQKWSNPVQTLFDILSFAPTLSVVMNCHNHIVVLLNLLISEGHQIQNILREHYHSNHDKENGNGEEEKDHTDLGVMGVDVIQATEKGVELCTTLKVFLGAKNKGKAALSGSESTPEFKESLTAILEKIVTPLLRCKATPSDSLNICTVVLGQLLLLMWKLDGCGEHETALNAGNLVRIITKNETVDGKNMEPFNTFRNLPELNQVALVRGLVATLPDDVLKVDDSETLLLVEMTSFILHVARVSTENGARLLGLKGLETVLGRWKTLLTLSNGSMEHLTAEANILSNQVLQVALATWESPPSRQIGSAVPGVFQSLVKLMGVLDRDGEKKSIDLLVTRVLAQPPSRKGRYVALEALLPKVGASKMLELAREGSSNALIPSFISEIGRHGNSSAAVAELFSKMMSMLRVEMHKEAGVDLQRNHEGNKKERRKKARLMRTNDTTEDSEKPKEEEILLLDDWNKVWAPALADALLRSEFSHRNQVAAFCLPLLATFVGGKGNRIDASHAFAILLDEICRKGTCLDSDHDEALIWAKFEVIRHAHLLKLLKLGSSSKILSKSVARTLPLNLVKATLFHESPKLRLTSFQSIAALIFTYDDIKAEPISYLEVEIGLWKEALPYAFKCSDKEYVVTLTQTLRKFLIRISDKESKCASCDGSYLLKFVNDFLLNDLFVKQAGYPGTVAEKEKWALSLIDCIVSFASQNDAFISTQNTVSRHSQGRKVSEAQQQWDHSIISNVLSEDVFSSLVCMMQSMWDNTRSSAYQIVLGVLNYANEKKMKLPEFLSDKNSFDHFQARAIHLASSPRQREADSGAKMLSVLCATLETPEAQFLYLDMLSNLLLERVIMMESSLGLNNSFRGGKTTTSVQEVKELPLAHGLIQSIRHVVDSCSFSDCSNQKAQNEKMVKTCFRAIEVSLVVVADVKDTDNEEKADGESNQDAWKVTRANQSKNVPLNVNTGAIGANATFASLDPVDDADQQMRLLKQRIIMGTWLLIKEACAALSSIIASSSVKDAELLSNAGNLLISTLTSLKHQGAAFAAHKSLQRLCSICYSDSCPSSQAQNEIRLLPSNWSRKLLHEILSFETVRDSTLRRSTGYGLGFLSILRSEEVSPRFLFPQILSNILKTCLPSSTVMREQMQKWKTSENEMFVYCKKMSVAHFISDEMYQERSRIHALNILRLAILDAPLATEMPEFIGDSIVAALIGYKDSSWGIRNSATMCFAAAMLRVVDADKNADVAFGNTKNKRTANAVTCKELFRSYPPLATALLSLIKEENSKPSSSDSLHPALFPLLLLLARLQPLSLQRDQPGDDDISRLFINPIMDCLGHVHHKVRLVAARALTVLCSGDTSYDESSRETILKKCLKRLSFQTPKDQHVSHNLDHGILLAVKYLLGSSSQPESYFNDTLLEAIVHFATWSDFKFTSPPSCAAAALEIWHIATKNCAEIEEKASIVEASVRVIRCVEEFSRRGLSMDKIGLSDLGKVASKIATQHAFCAIFDATIPEGKRMHYSQIVEMCFMSENYDVMVYSVKAFKKGVYDAVQRLVDSNAFVISVKKNILKVVSGLTVRCISKLLAKDKFAVHPPTLRRMSRIALECIYAFKCVDDEEETLVTDIIDLSVDDLWDISLQLLSLGRYEMTGKEETNPENLSGGNALAGNALELCSFSIFEMCHHCDKNFPTQEHVPKCIELFVNLIDQSTHPLSSWKTRHSAAIAVKESGLVQISIAACKQLGSTVESSRLQLCLQLLELFQDSDDDVRRATGRALPIRASLLPTIALMNLEAASSHMSEEYSNSEMFILLLERLTNICAGVESKLELVMKEYEYTKDAPDSAGILNLNTERKIFEEEDPNPFEEVLVIIQTIIVRLSNFPAEFDYNNGRTASLLSNLYAICSRILRDMRNMFQKTEGFADLAHNLTFDGNTFALIHGSILGTAFGFWLGFGDEEILQLTQDILKTSEKAALHPCISQVLRLLSEMKKGDPDSRSAILQSCFLLPSQRQIEK